MKRLILWMAPLALLCACGGGSGTAAAGQLAAPTPAPVPAPAPAPAPGSWVLDWSDEFDGAALDRTRWVAETGGGGWGNQELQHYTARPENLRVEGGNLVIEARREAYGGNAYTSARIKTAGLVERTYGRYEARIKVPKGQGMWAAFWMLGNDFPTAGWPACGEIDIMESIGKEPRAIYGTVHGPGYSGANGVGGRMQAAADFGDDFHVYAVEWEPGELRWYVDGTLFRTTTPAQLPGKWVFDHPFFVILNLAVGGNWPGPPDASTEFPKRMLVDYVRIYRRGS